MNRGLLYGVSAYLLWGFFPIYWKALKAIPATEIILHRILWSLAFLLILLGIRRRWAWLHTLRDRRRTLPILTASAALLALNWLTYVWSVNHGFIVETSLGYFITPLLSVVLGVLFLRERLRPRQWFAVGLAAVGVLYLSFGYGSFPWIALVLALSFGSYGLMKKKIDLEAVESLAAEMAILAPFSAALLLWLLVQGGATSLENSLSVNLLLLGAGAVTAIPLLFFGLAARRIPLSTLGLLQYIAPTLQFLLGVLLYHEPFTRERLIGFSIIWLALALYTLENLYTHRASISFRHP